MNQFIAPCRADQTHHRNHFEPSVRAALGLLDRAAEGQSVSIEDVQLALQVTGDAQSDESAGTDRREYARWRALRAFGSAS